MYSCRKIRILLHGSVFDEPSIISYPVVKSADNKEYLTKTFTESDNKLGAIFMDMRNTSDFLRQEYNDLMVII